MLKTNLRKVGGSVMLVVPPAILDALNLGAGQTVDLHLENGRLIIEKPLKVRYSLEELLAQCHPEDPVSPEDEDWLNLDPLGREL